MRTAEQIAETNDMFRTTMIEGVLYKVVVTSGVAAFQETNLETYCDILSAVRNFKTFTDSNDPNHEHDFGKVVVDGHEFFWKIDYYDENYEQGKNPYEGVTNLLLTIMRTDEY